MLLVCANWLNYICQWLAVMIFQWFYSCPYFKQLLCVKRNILYLNNIRFPTMGPYKQLILSFNLRRCSSTHLTAELSLDCTTCASALIKMVTLRCVLGFAKSPHSLSSRSSTTFKTSSTLRTRLDNILTNSSRTSLLAYLVMSLNELWSLKWRKLNYISIWENIQ